MNAPVRALAGALDVRWLTRIAALARVDAVARTGGTWRLEGEMVDDPVCRRVVVAVPAEQVPALLCAHAPEIAARAGMTASQPCWTVMAAFGAPLAIAADIVRGSGDAAIGWSARDSAKPGRSPGERWVLRASPVWSQAHLDDNAEAVVDALLGVLSTQAVAGDGAPLALRTQRQRWQWLSMGGGGRARRLR